MIKISENIEEKVESYKDWYIELNNLIGEEFDTDKKVEDTFCIGQKIIIEEENPKLPMGMKIPSTSDMKLEQLKGRTLEVIDISQIGDRKTVKLGIRSTVMADHE
jgi:hypothetical protein